MTRHTDTEFSISIQKFGTIVSVTIPVMRVRKVSLPVRIHRYRRFSPDKYRVGDAVLARIVSDDSGIGAVFEGRDRSRRNDTSLRPRL